VPRRIQKKINSQNKRKEKYQAISRQLEESGQEQLSTTDPDAKAVILHRGVVNVGYNVQASVDAKNKLIPDFETGDVNDGHGTPTQPKAKQWLSASNATTPQPAKDAPNGKNAPRERPTDATSTAANLPR
jgi:hypothetical protein